METIPKDNVKSYIEESMKKLEDHQYSLFLEKESEAKTTVKQVYNLLDCLI